jgi:methionine-S-sulfoxide reductase
MATPASEEDVVTRTSPETAVLAGGCFWGMQALLSALPGVISTRVGYAGGTNVNATYGSHGDHAEAVEVVFDSEQLTYRALLEYFFQIHDPTTKNRQGYDVGADYRSAVLYTSDQQTGHCRGHDRGRERILPVARQGRHRSRPCRDVLGSRTRASELP